ncbi:MAG: hypothetical protein EBT92_19590, partial [Planctomycetes bacterium]|nr:hypothetical protein [Planctomycetota bacterium]
NDDAGKETIRQLTNPDIIQNIIRGTIGIGPEVIGGMIKKMLPENSGDFFKQWSKVILDGKTVSDDMITPTTKAASETSNGSSTDKQEELDDSLFEDAAFENISKIQPTQLSEEEHDSCLNGFYPDPMFDELAFYGEINWAGLALSTLALSQFRTFSKDKPKTVRSIKISA